MSEPAPPPPTRTVTVSLDLHRLPSAVTALGVALVSTTIVLSAYYSRANGDLDGSTFLMGVLASAGLLVVAAGAHLLLPGAEERASLVSWPGAAGIVGSGVMLAVQINNETAAAYGAGALILLVSALAYAGTSAAPFALGSLVGAALLYVQAFGDLFGADGDEDTSFVTVGAGILFFVGAATAVGWLLPRIRVLIPVVVGAGAVVLFASLFASVAIFSSLSAAFSEGSPAVSYDGSYEQLTGEDMSEPYVPDEDGEYYSDFLEESDEDSFDSQVSSFRKDLKVLMAYSAALALFWALCAWASGHVAFRILSVAILVLSVPATTIGLTVSHPTWWQVGLTAGGAVLLGLVGYRQARPAAPTAPA